MNKIKNKVQLIGNVGQTPAITILENGKKVARFSMATNEQYKNSNGDKVKRTSWHSITAWEKIADIVEKYVSKGREIAVEGKLISRSYEDKEGVKRYATVVVISELLLLGNHENTL